jgi:transcriptional regulator with XRE-family HTH domain
MFKRTRPPKRRRDEARAFAGALLALRGHMEWTQAQLGARLGVSRRTLTNWECGYWLPPHKQRVHIVLALKEAPPAHILNVANGLGVSANPAASFLLKEFEYALEHEDDDEDALAPVPRPTPEELKVIADAIVREGADALDVRPSDLRGVMVKLLDACAAKGAALKDVLAAATPKVKAK